MYFDFFLLDVIMGEGFLIDASIVNEALDSLRFLSDNLLWEELED